MIPALSDSHIPRRAERLPPEFRNVLDRAEKAVHCGDFVSEDFRDRIAERVEELVAVKGNCDFFKLPESRTLQINGHRIGVYHGSGIEPRGHHPTLLSICEKMGVDVLFHGHTHHLEAVKKNGQLLLNPGSCTGVGGGSASRGNPTMMKVGFGGRIKVEKLEKKSGQLKTSEETFKL